MRIDGHLAVGRLGARSDADLAWETELIQHLDREGLTVPVPIPTTDGRLFVDGRVGSFCAAFQRVLDMLGVKWAAERRPYDLWPSVTRSWGSRCSRAPRGGELERRGSSARVTRTASITDDL